MVLNYKFKKEKLESGQYVSRPRILITITGKNMSIEAPALIDTGCDTTVIPEGIAKAVGLNLDGPEEKLYGFRGKDDVIESKADINFLGKEVRQEEKLNGIPVLILLLNEKLRDEEEITLGINGIFDAFDINFKKISNKILFKRVQFN